MNKMLLAQAVEHELAASAAARRAGDRGAAWSSLERAHVLSQPLPGPHVRVHAHMLAAAVRDRDVREALGQLLRLLVAAPASALGRYPRGNTGRARVSMTAPMPIPPDLRRTLEDGRTIDA